MPRLRSSRNLLVAPMVIRMVLDVWKHLKTTHLINPNSFCFINCLKKSIPGDVRAQVLQEPVGGSHGDQVQKSGVPSIFLTLGVKPDPMIPHT